MTDNNYQRAPHICAECGAHVAQAQRAQHKDEHDALVLALELLLEGIKGVHALGADVAKRVMDLGERVATIEKWAGIPPEWGPDGYTFPEDASGG